MQAFFDNINSKVVDDLRVSIKEGSKLSIASACFSIYAFQELKEQLQGIDELRFISRDYEELELTRMMLADITPENDSKLQQLIKDLRYKFNNPINGQNKKVIIFTAFSDTAVYLYDNLADRIIIRS